jgi:hypothetical protein
MKFKHILLVAMLVAIPLGVITSAASIGVTPAIVSNRQAVLTASNPGSEINVRTAPTTQSVAPYFGIVGDRVQVLKEARGNDGYTWYYVKFNSKAGKGWVRQDLLRLVDGGTIAANPQPRPPSPQPISPQSEDSSSNPSSATSPYRSTSPYSAEQIDYFLEVALGNEFGGGGARIKKWQGPVRIKVNGSPTAEDTRTLQQVMNEVNELANGAVQLAFDDNKPNVQIYFVPESQFKRYEPNYRPRNLGFFWARWNQNIIQDSKVLITTTGVTQKERSHLIREELTQSLGLMRDSYRYRNSIFYQGWTDPTEYADIDRAVVQMLYRPEIRPGMTKTEVMAALQNLAITPPSPRALNNQEANSPAMPVPAESPLDFSF